MTRIDAVQGNAWVGLEPFSEGLRETVRAAGADPALWRFHVQNHHGATFDRYFDWTLAAQARGDAVGFAVFDRASGACVGSSSFLAIAAEHKRLEIGSTWYAAPFQGGRVNPATKLALMGHVFEALGWNRVEFKVDARNARSLAAMRKLGAIEEGTFRAHMVLPDGWVRDSVYFAVTNRDWPEVKARLEARLGTA